MTLPWQIFAPTGSEDVAFWQSNNLRMQQQVALGMLGAIQRVAGSIQPVAILEDLRSLSESSSIHTFGGYTGGTAGRTGVMEIHAPSTESVSVSLLMLFSTCTTAGLRQQIRVLSPNTSTDLAVISIGARELDDGWNQYHQTHQCRVFIGWQPAPAPPAGPCTAATTTDTHGMNIDMDAITNKILAFDSDGLKIPRGRNLCVSNWHESGSANLCQLWGCMVREYHPPSGPVGVRV